MIACQCLSRILLCKPDSSKLIGDGANYKVYVKYIFYRKLFFLCDQGSVLFSLFNAYMVINDTTYFYLPFDIVAK